MINAELSWQEAAGAAVCLAVAATALRRASRTRPPDAGRPDSARRGEERPDGWRSDGGRSDGGRSDGERADADPANAGRRRLAAVASFLRETALVLGLFALWQIAGAISVLGTTGALSRARWIWHAERILHLPSEAALQRVFLPHPLIVQIFDLYYDILHFPVLIICLIWLFVRHRDHYPRFRTTLVAFTGISLLIQLIPVAPPRMLPGAGMVDTAARYGQSVYPAHGGFDPDQLSAMPSVHVGWAVLVAIAVVTVARTPWRWLAPLYPMLTMLAVVVTANHFWLDGIVAAAVLAAVIIAQAAGRRALDARAWRRLARPGRAASQTSSPEPIMERNS